MQADTRMRDERAIEKAEVTSAASGSQRVRDVMRLDFITISPEESLLEALHVMRFARLRHLAVVSEGVLVGILSYRDLQDELISSLRLESPATIAPSVAQIGVVERMARSPYSIVPGATLSEAASRFERLQVGCLPVVEPGERGPQLVGLLTAADLLRAAYHT